MNRKFNIGDGLSSINISSKEPVIKKLFEQIETHIQGYELDIVRIIDNSRDKFELCLKLASKAGELYALGESIWKKSDFFEKLGLSDGLILQVVADNFIRMQYIEEVFGIADKISDMSIPSLEDVRRSLGEEPLITKKKLEWNQWQSTEYNNRSGSLSE